MEKQDLLDLLKGELVLADVKAGDALVLAISGGPDSMALLDLMSGIAKKENINITVVHINHGIRSSAAKDQKLVEAYCGDKGIECVSKFAKLTGIKTGLEEKSREARYRFLHEVRQEKKAKWILTAHNSDDQVETIVWNFLRGSGVRGMGGMRVMSETILRPLLNVKKVDLLKYVKTFKIPFVIDESNKSLEFTRNQIRLELLPILEKYNPAFREVILANSDIFRQSDSLIQQLAARSFTLIGESQNGKVNISISRLRELLPIIQMEIMRLAIQKISGNLQGIKKNHIEDIFALIANKQSRSKKMLPHKLLVEKACDTITISQVEK